MWERLVKWWDLREDVRTLRGLDDRMLEDMGLSRAEIRACVMAGTAEEARPVPCDPGDPSGRAVAC